jgi:hypothetical protein
MPKPIDYTLAAGIGASVASYMLWQNSFGIGDFVSDIPKELTTFTGKIGDAASQLPGLMNNLSLDNWVSLYNDAKGSSKVADYILGGHARIELMNMRLDNVIPGTPDFVPHVSLPLAMIVPYIGLQILSKKFPQNTFIEALKAVPTAYYGALTYSWIASNPIALGAYLTAEGVLTGYRVLNKALHNDLALSDFVPVIFKGLYGRALKSSFEAAVEPKKFKEKKETEAILGMIRRQQITQQLAARTPENN